LCRGQFPMEISSAEISTAIRLVREVCDRWDDPRVWREHLLQGACALLGGNVATIFEVGAPAAPGHLGAIRPVAIFGLPTTAQKALVHTSTDFVSNRDIKEISNDFLPGQDKFWAEFQKHGWVTAARDQLTDAATYHAAAGYQNLRRHADCDDYIWSMRFVDLPRRIEMFGLDRPHGAAPFGPREVMLLKLLHDEIAPLIGVRLATEEHLCREGLSKRLRETLSLLLDGKSEKEAARELQLSPKTVHEYITSIYQHFNVCSRAELLAYFVHRTPKVRPEDEPGATHC
jgi:DNA-binding CsgD family transcriptional regulator